MRTLLTWNFGGKKKITEREREMVGLLNLCLTILRGKCLKLTPIGLE